MRSFCLWKKLEYKNGNAEAFTLLYQESSKYIYTCIYKVMKGNDNALDIISDIMQDREKQRLLREIIDNSLTEMQKLCIIAYYFQEQKQSEIASELGIPENTVKTNLSRAKQKIRDGVLELEKKNGTRLYSVAPFLLLFFKEEVDAAVVPDAVTAGVYTAIRQSVAAANMANTVASTDMGNAC